MVDAKQMSQMAEKKGFIAALDQSGGSTPGALRLYGIAGSDYSGDEEMFRLMHEMRVRIIDSAQFFRRQGHRRHPVREDHGWRGRGQAGPFLSVGGSRCGAFPQS